MQSKTVDQKARLFTIFCNKTLIAMRMSLLLLFLHVFHVQVVQAETPYSQAASVAEAMQQRKTVTGTVVDATGLPVIGANVIEIGTTNGTVTDVDGKFSLSVANNATIRITYIGYLEQDVSTTGRTSFDITLVEDTKALDEVVVVGYGTVRKSDLTGAIGSVSASKIANVPQTGVTSLLQGKVAGVNITSISGAGDMQIRVRGTTSLNKSNEPLWVVDGVIGAPAPSNPNDIESIQVLKDASATSIYGSQGANGVILVTTKRAGHTCCRDTKWFGILCKKSPLDEPLQYACAYNEVNGAGPFVMGYVCLQSRDEGR